MVGKTEMFTNLEETETYNIWLSELKELTKQYQKFCEIKEKSITEVDPSKVKGGKKKKKTKK